MKAITQRESVITYIKSCLIFQIPRFMLISKYRVMSPLSAYFYINYGDCKIRKYLVFVNLPCL